jgi:[ribosomal protein S5]-alanine N-acetyltransferase
VSLPRIETPRLVLTMLAPAAAERAAVYWRDNREHIARWQPPRPPDFETAGFWRDRLQRSLEEHAGDRSLRLEMLRREDEAGPVVGWVSFTEIVRGPVQLAWLGYQIDGRMQGQGLMYEALSAAIPWVFTHLALHRVQAGYEPINERSGRLLRRLGFTVEGYARDYIFIAGAWRDQIITSIANPAPLTPR